MNVAYNIVEFNDVNGNKQTLDLEKHENIAFNADCMEFLRNCPDNAFDLCVCDPPYGDGRSQYIHVERERERELDLNGTGLVGDSTNTSITRTGGTWAEKYGKKS